MPASVSHLDDGDTLDARRVVMATGLLGHEYRPAEFDGLPRSLVSHSCEHTDSERYRGKRVAVIGRGQSGCESAALLHEAGADVELICRGDLIWNADPGQRSVVRKAVRSILGNMLIPPSQVGPFPHNWLNEAPGIIHRLSTSRRDQENEISLRATAVLWLRSRMKDVPVNQHRSIMAAHRVGDQVALTLDNGIRRFDHVLLATGYRIDVDKMSLLDQRLRQRIARHGGLPVLSGGMESSVPGLHFVGAAAVASYGPLLRFIAGAGFAARRVTRAVRRGVRTDRRSRQARASLFPPRPCDPCPSAVPWSSAAPMSASAWRAASGARAFRCGCSPIIRCRHSRAMSRAVSTGPAPTTRTASPRSSMSSPRTICRAGC